MCIYLQEIEEYFVREEREMNLATRVLVRRFIDYIWRFWINTVGVVAFSVFGKIHRTNNLNESINFSISQTVNGIHVPIWKFLCKYGLTNLVCSCIDFFLTSMFFP